MTSELRVVIRLRVAGPARRPPGGRSRQPIHVSKGPPPRHAPPRGSPRHVDKLPSRALPTIDDVLTFWFDDASRWWTKDPAFDAEIRDSFLELHGAILRDERMHWVETSPGTLAYVVVLDQFSRNMFRDSALMYEGDPRALTAARRALDSGFDRGRSADERMFLYMPFMHSEAIADQDRCVALFAAGLQKWLLNAEQHRDIIRRFGRFPHRNALLGRPSTSEELEFLKQPGSSF
jgi:uncharacterized protein (DUF924 family)